MYEMTVDGFIFRYTNLFQNHVQINSHMNRIQVYELYVLTISIQT